MAKLSQKLFNLGFFSALGTIEEDGDNVVVGPPNTRDYNNGIRVVYDEEGRPWILHFSKMSDKVEAELRVYNLKHGAYVPHSNDGGRFGRFIRDFVAKP